MNDHFVNRCKAVIQDSNPRDVFTIRLDIGGLNHEISADAVHIDMIERAQAKSLLRNGTVVFYHRNI